MSQNVVVKLGAPVQDGQVFVVKIMHGANLTEKAKEEVRLRMLLCGIDGIPLFLFSLTARAKPAGAE